MSLSFNTQGGIPAHCPDCKVPSSFEGKYGGSELGYTEIGSPHDKPHAFEGKPFTRIIYKLYRCAGCGRGALAKVYCNGNLQDGVIAELIPYSAEVAKLPSDTPADIKAEYDEALKCFSAGAFRAASAMARSVLEKILKANGYNERDLYNKIEAAAKDGLLTDSRRKRAQDDVKSLGNDVLHDTWIQIPEADATKALHYAQRIMEDFYDNRTEVLAVLAQKNRLNQSAPSGTQAP